MSLAFELLKEIAYIRSFSGQEEPLVDYLAMLLDEHNIPYNLEPLGGYSYNLVIGPEEASLAIVTHLDTIPREGKIEISKDKISGPGIADVKAGVALAVALALENHDVQIALLAQEETTGIGSAKYLERYRPRYAIVLEPTYSRLAFAGHGMISGEIRCYGEEMHPDRAAIRKDLNAITRLLESLSNLSSLPIAPLSLSAEGEFYTPAEARAYIEISLRPKEKPLEMLKAIRSALGENCEFLLEDLDEAFETLDELFIERLREAYKKVYGELRERTMPSRTDGNTLAHAGIPVAIFGPGEFERIHTPREEVKREELEKAFEFLSLASKVLTKGI